MASNMLVGFRSSPDNCQYSSEVGQLVTLKIRLMEGSQEAFVVKNSPADAGDVRDPSFILGLGRSAAWRIPQTEETGRLQSTRSQRFGHN